ncbi:FadR/GntR family transcriptional regulator [Treponema sp.]
MTTSNIEVYSINMSDKFDIIEPENHTSDTNLLRITQDYIKNYIQSSGLRSGDLLPTEKKLVSTLGISRTVIREALKGLQQLGITDSRQGKGHFLREFNFDAALTGLDYLVKPSLKSFRDLLEIRMYLESVFLTRDVFLFSEVDLIELSKLIDGMEEQIRKGIGEDVLIDAHTLFHQKLYKHSENMFLIELINMFSTMQHKLITIHEYRTSNRDDFIHDHRAILDSIRGRQPEVVRSMLINHFSEPLAWVQDRMKTEKSPDLDEGRGGK